MTRLLGALFALLTLPALAADPVSVTLSRSGLDSRTDAANERLEIAYDGLVRWETSGFGMTAPGCPNQGGSFQGRVTRDEALSIARLARSALTSQKKKKNTHRYPRAVTTSIWFDLDGRADSGDVVRWTPQYEALTKALDALETSLRPKALVLMRAERDGDTIRARFDLVGDKPAKVLIPDNATEAFSAGTSSLRYVSAPKEDTELELTPSNRHAEVLLHVEGPAAASAVALRYSNAIGLHHSKGDALDGDLTAPALGLCAPLSRPE